MVPNLFLIIITVIYVSWLIQATYQVLTWTYWIQDKEYRWDRFRVLLSVKNTDGLKELQVVYISIKLILLFGSIFAMKFLDYYLLTLLVFDLLVMVKLAKRLIRRPVFTTRAKWIVFATGLTTVLIILLSSGTLLYEFIAAEISLLVVPALVVIITGVSVNNTKRHEMLKTGELLMQVKPKIIGVTGSYGKTTTKDFIAQILSRKFKVVKTVGSRNTEFGVYRDILSQLMSDTDYLVCEVGAYTTGEIARIAGVLKPEIAVVTGIEPQHLEIFGSLKNIKKAKFELIEALRPNGIALFNMSNKHCAQLADLTAKVRPDVKIFGYGVNLGSNNNFDQLTSTITKVADTLDFKVKFKSKVYNFTTNVASVNLIENISGAILVGLLSGVSYQAIRRTCANLVLPAKTLQVVKLNNNVVVIDDTFNATPKGFDAAINYTESFAIADKIIITTGIIELGHASAKVHSEIAQKIAGKFSKVYLRNSQFARFFKTGLAASKTDLQVITDIKQLRFNFNRIVSGGNVLVLLEGKLPKVLMDDLDKHTHD